MKLKEIPTAEDSSMCWLLNTFQRPIALFGTSFANRKVYDWFTIAEK